jgi:hypothetical protein
MVPLGIDHDPSSTAFSIIAGSFTTAAAVIGPIGSAFGFAAHSLVVVVAADDGLALAASYSGLSVDAGLQYNKGIGDDTNYCLPILLMLTEVRRYLHVRLTMCGCECTMPWLPSATLLARRALATLT